MGIKPGDLIVARVNMKTWESLDYRGRNGAFITPGMIAFVVAIYVIGQVRLILIINDGLEVCSHRIGNVERNWARINDPEFIDDFPPDHRLGPENQGYADDLGIER